MLLMIAWTVITIDATDAPAVADWLQGQLQLGLEYFNTYERDPWPYTELVGVRIDPASESRPFPMVQVGSRYPALPDEVNWFALWAELRPMGNGQIDVLIGGDNEIEGVAWLIGKLTEAIRASYRVVAEGDPRMPKYLQDDQPAGRRIVTTGAAIVPGASPASDPNRPGEDLVLIDRKILNLSLGQAGLEATPAKNGLHVGIGGKPGRPSYPDDEWARHQVHTQNRPAAEVYLEWVKRPGVQKRELIDYQESFKKLIKTPPKK